MATFIRLAHLVNNQPAPLYVNVHQIVRVGSSAGSAPDYPTHLKRLPPRWPPLRHGAARRNRRYGPRDG